MAELINLRQARKRKARNKKEFDADVNRAKFGQSKSVKFRSKALLLREKSNLDGHKLSTSSTHNLNDRSK